MELFGEADLDADIEVISLLIEVLNEAELTEVSLDLGHVGIFRALAAACNLSADQENELFALLQAKAMADIGQWIEDNIVDPKQAQWLLNLPKLSGSVFILDQAAEILASAPAPVQGALAELARVAESLRDRFPDVNLYLDLSELRGYHYHTGVVFAAFTAGIGREIASGGRYDHIGEIFGRARPATGFTANLIDLKRLGRASCDLPKGIFVPRELNSRDGNGADLWQFIQQLRRRGERVVCASATHPRPHAYQACDRQLVEMDGEYQIQSLLNT